MATLINPFYDAQQLAELCAMPEWTPEFGALVVSGVMPPANPESRLSPGRYASAIEGPKVAYAYDVIAVWRMQQNPPATLSPTNFVAWCISEGIDLFWFRPSEKIGAHPLDMNGKPVAARLDGSATSSSPYSQVFTNQPRSLREPVPATPLSPEIADAWADYRRRHEQALADMEAKAQSCLVCRDRLNRAKRSRKLDLSSLKQRENQLDDVIQKAIDQAFIENRNAGDDDIWRELVKIARQEKPPKPIKDYLEDSKIVRWMEWTKAGEMKIQGLDYKLLCQRLDRARNLQHKS